MNRPFRPRPLDIYKKLPIVKSVKDLDSDEASIASRALLRGNSVDVEPVQATPSKRRSAEIPTPEFVVVDSYERDYLRTFGQPSTYVRGRGSRAESTDFVDYDLDNEDEDWLQQFNSERDLLSTESFEWMLYKLELLDHKTRERAGAPAVFGVLVPVCLQQEAALEALQLHIPRPTSMLVLSAVYGYWKAKREQWQKPILRCLQPRPPVNDVNPFNVFRPREKTHRPHTRRMQRRENDVQSFEKLRQVHRNLEQARSLMEMLQKREVKKRELLDCEANLQKMWITLKHDQQVDDDFFSDGSLELSAPFSWKTAPYRRDDGYETWNRANSSAFGPDLGNGHMYMHPCSEPSSILRDGMDSSEYRKPTWKRKRGHQSRGRPLRKISTSESLDAVFLFTKPVDSDKLTASGIVPPSDSSGEHFRGRIGRGGRLIFDRWNPLSRTPIGHTNASSLSVTGSHPRCFAGDHPSICPPHRPVAHLSMQGPDHSNRVAPDPAAVEGSLNLTVNEK